MSDEIPQMEAHFGTKRTKMEINKALASLGFGGWNELEPGKISDGSTAMPTQFNQGQCWCWFQTLR